MFGTSLPAGTLTIVVVGVVIVIVAVGFFKSISAKPEEDTES